MPKLLIGAFVLWLAGLVLACLRFSTSARWLIGLGAAAGVAGSVSALPHGGTDLTLPIALADQAGLDVIVDRCMKVEHARFGRGLSTSGINSGLITSRRAGERP